MLDENAWQATVQALAQAAGTTCPAVRGHGLPLHGWWAEVLLPALAPKLPTLTREVCTLQSLHRRAALGVRGGLGEWRAGLAPLLPALYRRAYAYQAAYAQAYDSALAYAQAPANAEGMEDEPGGAVGFAEHYARLSTDASAAAFAQAHAGVALEYVAQAFAHGDGLAYSQIVRPLTRVCLWAAAATPNERAALAQQWATALMGELDLSQYGDCDA